MRFGEGLANPMRSERIEKKAREGQESENKQLVKLGVSYIDKNWKWHVWRCGNAPEIQMVYLQLY